MAGEVRSLEQVIGVSRLREGDGIVVEVSRASWWWNWIRFSAPWVLGGFAMIGVIATIDATQGNDPFPLLLLGLATVGLLAAVVIPRQRRATRVWLESNGYELLLYVRGADRALVEREPIREWSRRVAAQMVVVGDDGLGLEVAGEVNWLRPRGVSLVVSGTTGGYVRDCTFVGPDGQRTKVFATGRLGR